MLVLLRDCFLFLSCIRQRAVAEQLSHNRWTAAFFPSLSLSCTQLTAVSRPGGEGQEVSAPPRTSRKIHARAIPPSTAAVPPHEGVTSDRVDHFHEGQGSHGDLAGAQSLEARLLVEGNQEVLAHEHGAPHVGEAAQVLQVAPHQDGAFALLAESSVHGQHVDVDGVAVRLVEGQRVLVGKQEVTEQK